jgi:hypothetical protein
MGFVTVKHTPDPTKFEKPQQTSLHSTTSRTADASYPSIGNSSRDVNKSNRLGSPQYLLQHSHNSRQSSQQSRHEGQQSQNSQSQGTSKALHESRYIEEADLTLDEHQIAEIGEIIAKKRPRYELISSSITRSTLQLSLDDLITGRVIGLGGFGMVRKVKSPILKEKTSRPCVIKTCKPSSGPSIVSSVTHLMRERYYLSHLKHPHIVRMVAASEHQDPVEAILQSKRIDACFLILEYLPETLHDRIQSWKKRRQELAKREKAVSWNLLRGQHSNRSDTAFSLSSQADNDLFAQQLIVALEVASALEYLHSQRVIFRDLKPSNVGLDLKGSVKIYDFGLATQLANRVDLDTTHSLPGRVGTTRVRTTRIKHNLLTASPSPESLTQIVSLILLSPVHGTRSTSE